MDSVLSDSDWYEVSLGRITKAEIIVFRCSGCDRHIVVDGVYRIIWIAAYGNGDEVLDVTELSGEDWPENTPDLNVVCICKPYRVW